MKNEIVVGAVSKIPTQDGIESTYQIMETCVKEYSHVDLLCFGELFLLKDPKYLDNIENEEALKKITYQIRNLAIRYNMAISYGCVLKERGKVYISQIVAFPDQSEYIYRKVHLGKNEKIIYNYGDTIDVFNYRGYTFGIQICIDTHIMEMSILQKLMGAEIIIAPFNTPYDCKKRLKNWSKYIPMRAYECNMCFICNNYHGGIQMVNGYGDVVRESIDTNCVEVYTFSKHKDFNENIDYFAYRRSNLYNCITCGQAIKDELMSYQE
ncbi:MAG: nitrilase-related carbon-nitrogen hydrolase [Sedimentibacter sp.]|uniref:nitrilase-related carbon-nitrogen hydrolase n=1 Tax=Sedimentibacter sp. TaxID=1960295 RepID=UPI002981EF7A|nr:nitrilase-related carbon-nitrogen hydrolase [Sedimentibacter sp.]MDW5300295.1 nitrilase-related carbon-nitrogen hydrolase [Sedimentibacter sp.]